MIGAFSTEIVLFISKGAKVTRSTSAYALPIFLPRPKNSKQKAPIQGKNNLSKVGSWEQLSGKPQNAFLCPVLTYHFLILIGALVYQKKGLLNVRIKLPETIDALAQKVVCTTN